jgi:precorrin-3B methylase
VSARRGSLVVVGTGISLVGQTTIEAAAEMQRAERLFYLVTSPAAERWIRRLNQRAESLHDCYAEGKPRGRTYREMAERILAGVRGGFRVCAAFYGHPGVFVRPSHDAIRKARREGFAARMLPGISAEDCLFADLGLNPGESGCQSFEATDFLGSRRRFDASTPLILWQVGVLGESSVRVGMSCRPERLAALVRVLRRHYPPRHPVVLYEAAHLPVCQPAIRRVRLDRLPLATILPMTTVYIPPRPSGPLTARVSRWLEE